MLLVSWSQVPNSCLAKLIVYTSKLESCSNEGALYSFTCSYVGFQQTLMFSIPSLSEVYSEIQDATSF